MTIVLHVSCSLGEVTRAARAPEFRAENERYPPHLIYRLIFANLEFIDH